MLTPQLRAKLVGIYLPTPSQLFKNMYLFETLMCEEKQIEMVIQLPSASQVVAMASLGQAEARIQEHYLGFPQGGSI